MNADTESIAKYRADGYLVLENFLEENACRKLKLRAEELVREFEPGESISIFSTQEQTRRSDEYFLNSGDKIRFFFEEHAINPDGTLQYEKELAINKIGHALHDLDETFSTFSRSVPLRQLASALGMNNPLLAQSMYIFKQPGIGGEVICHQDSTFLYTVPESVVGLWFALEDATLENGCLWAIPGGHELGLGARFVRDGAATKFQQSNQIEWPMDRLVPLEVKAGTLIVLNGQLPHLSRRNNSTRSRHAYTLHLIDGNCEYPSENWLRRSPENPFRGFE